MGAAAHWAVSITGGIGIVAVQILLTIILVAILYSQGETAARGALAFGFRLGGERGRKSCGWRRRRCAAWRSAWW